MWASMLTEKLLPLHTHCIWSVRVSKKGTGRRVTNKGRDGIVPAQLQCPEVVGSMEEAQKTVKPPPLPKLISQLHFISPIMLKSTELSWSN